MLELGGNVGVTSCLINKLTKYKYEHTVTENHSFLSQILEKHKSLNNCNFKILPYNLNNINLINNNYKYNTLISDIEGDEYEFIINNFEYISMHINLIIIEFHTLYFCKNQKTINKSLIQKCHQLLNTKYKIIDNSNNVFVYQSQI